MTNLHELSEDELENLINNAGEALKSKQNDKRKVVISQIKELAASVDLQVDIYEGEKKSTRKGAKVPVKYQDPDNLNNKWTGRGVTPKWLQTHLGAGRQREEFRI